MGTARVVESRRDPPRQHSCTLQNSAGNIGGGGGTPRWWNAHFVSRLWSKWRLTCIVASSIRSMSFDTLIYPKPRSRFGIISPLHKSPSKLNIQTLNLLSSGNRNTARAVNPCESQLDLWTSLRNVMSQDSWLIVSQFVRPKWRTTSWNHLREIERVIRRRNCEFGQLSAYHAYRP